jgi:hypothetical protein
MNPDCTPGIKEVLVLIQTQIIQLSLHKKQLDSQIFVSHILVQYFVCIFLEQTETQVGESQVCTASRLGNNSGSFSCETQFRVGMFTYLNIASIKTKEFFC